jgi:hypothetical protein
LKYASIKSIEAYFCGLKSKGKENKNGWRLAQNIHYKEFAYIQLD